MVDVVRGECEAKEGGGGENHLSRSHQADKKKSIFMQLLEYPIPPLTAAALQMIICKRPAPLTVSLTVKCPLFFIRPAQPWPKVKDISHEDIIY